MPTPMPISELLGQKFNRLTIVAEASAKSGPRRMVCQCICGTEKVIPLGDLRSEHTTSCGCLKRELSAARLTTHGLTDHPLYKTWYNMVDRCTNPASNSYKDYAARGIKICERWKENVENYIEDIDKKLGPKPSPQHTVDRIENGGNYELSNVRWALPVVQNNNQRLRKYAGKQPKGASGVVGVTHQPSGKWKARIQCNGKDIHLGYYDTLQEAVAVREGAEAGLDYQRGRSEF